MKALLISTLILAGCCACPIINKEKPEPKTKTITFPWLEGQRPNIGFDHGEIYNLPMKCWGDSEKSICGDNMIITTNPGRIEDAK